MNNINYTPGNFLRFHVNKGTESDSKGVTVAIRSTTFDNVQDLDKPLIITVDGEEGMMVLRPEDMREKIVHTSRQLANKSYSLLRYRWLPIPVETIEILDTLYTFKRQFDERIINLLKATDGIED